jgi:hypothetical protein
MVEFSKSSESKVLTPEPTTVQAAIPPQGREKINSLAAAASGPEKKVILRIEGVEIPANRGALVNVFVNQPNATAASGPDDPGFVGTIAVVASQAGGALHAHPLVRNFSFDLTGKLAALASDPNVAVTLVPATGSGQKPSAVSVRYGRIFITTRE